MDFKVSDFGDYRLDEAATFLHDRLVRIGPRGLSVRGLGGSRAGEVRIGRFLRNGKVSVEKIVNKAARATSTRVDNMHILAIQDTTSFRDDGSGNSLVGHATIAIEAEEGAMLGLVDTQLIERFGNGKTPPKNRPLCDKQSQRWIDSMQTSAELLQSAALVTVVADREGDIFEMFACRPKGVEVLIRAAQDRLTDDNGKLFSSLKDRPEQEHTVELPARPGQKKRSAQIAVRFNRVTLKQPKGRPVKSDVPVRQPIYIVEAKEVDPPEGVRAAHWRLLTSHRVETFEQARWITQLYRRRWVIEQLFRTIKKKGFDIENVSMETAPFKTFCAMTLVAGVSCMQLVQGRDGQGKRPLEDVFDPEDQTALEAVSDSLEGKTAKQKNPHPKGSLAFASWVCARLGGWTGYYGKPGPVVMLRGLYQFRSIQLGYEIARYV